MFKITHYANSFISIQGEKSVLTCDPWIGATTDNAWYSYPLKNENDVNKKVFNSNFIYVSHLHCDHIDQKTLKKFTNKNLTFIVKKFKNGTLKNRLQRLFPDKKIIELEPFTKKKISKDFSVSIIPQIISNTSDLPDNIEYDLDTSIVVQSNKSKEIFYNNVDMPINLRILKLINNFVKKTFKKNIDIFCLPLGAACEFPQCFLNLDRDKERKKLVKQSLKDLKKYLKYLKPKVFFPAGGTYAIYGKFHKLNKFIAQPSFPEIRSATSKLKTKIYNIIGGGHINFENSKYLAKETDVNIANNFDKKFINYIKNYNYYYYNRNKKTDLNELDNVFDKAKLNYFRILAHKKGITTKWDIDFNIYKNYELNDKCKIDIKKSKFLKKYQLSNHNDQSKKVYKLECYMEYDLFKSLLSGRFPWNTSLTGSTIMYKRTPNIFNVDQQFSLNFLRV